MHSGVKQTSSHFASFDIMFFDVCEPFNASAVDGSISTLTVSVLVWMQVRLQVQTKMHKSDELMDMKHWGIQAKIKLKLHTIKFDIVFSLKLLACVYCALCMFFMRLNQSILPKT